MKQIDPRMDGRRELMMDDADKAGERKAGDREAVASSLRLARASRDGKEGGGNSGAAVITRTKTQTKKPNLDRVLLLNDDYTPMEFVIHVLERFFSRVTRNSG